MPGTGLFGSGTLTYPQYEHEYYNCITLLESPDMTDFARARLNMVNAQLLTNGVHNPVLVEAYSHLARETLVDAAHAPCVYRDEELPLPNARFVLEPMTEGRMLQEAIRAPAQAALVLGAASLPAVAILTRFIETVVVVEPDTAMCHAAHDRLSARDGAHVTLVNASYVDGHAAKAPYDLIFVPGAMAKIPPRLVEQLALDGRLICVLRESPRAQGRITVIRRLPTGGVDTTTLADAGTPYLVGFEPAAEFVF